MTTPARLSAIALDIDTIADAEGVVALLVEEDGSLGKAARRVNRLTKGALARLVASERFEKLDAGGAVELAYPVGLAAETLLVVKVARNAQADVARAAGAEIGKVLSGRNALVLAGNFKRIGELALGALLRHYDFTDHKGEGAAKDVPTVTVAHTKPETLDVDAVTAQAVGVFTTRDLVSEPSNVLTTTEFAARLETLRDLGVEVEVLDEEALEKLGMRTLLAVGQGSTAPSKVVVMQWQGGNKDDAPLALVGKGVVFDTGGISIKPAAGMEDMTMDMGGAGVVAGVMRTLAMRKASANVVGLVGLVENMPDGNAIRPGDVVKSMKGDTVEIINTDAEGRLVLCDVMWYAQERFAPRAMVDLATLTGAIIIGLGHDNAGVFSNDDDFCKSFLKAAEAEGEGAWRMPLGASYDKQLKSPVADMKNVGGRPAGSITAAQFLQRFVKEGTPWIHLDIAGVAKVAAPTTLAPKGATGWGVRALNRLVDDLVAADAKE
ncbi:leucyl aminopeptidase [Celeribacter sp.]|uniref:leucyl aminopeptidase n=1 Tax=Celeribacter sp. TaxID=1890673 RepID=UPI003A8E17F6